ncbi:hypothetical protein BN2497_5889 [Janthinobacterium sp. CG23_2]|nr:hypothetical protein BN2497_5889 [Janthinobacterium sp. CG23_2]CUU29342.1 hypothetical protein BN3177_5889 [Janthinobacterium sp. CG23_2]
MPICKMKKQLKRGLVSYITKKYSAYSQSKHHFTSLPFAK